MKSMFTAHSLGSMRVNAISSTTSEKAHSWPMILAKHTCFSFPFLATNCIKSFLSYPSMHFFIFNLNTFSIACCVMSIQVSLIIVWDYMEDLILKYPYWNRSLGADDFFLTCHDMDVQATRGVPLLVKNSIQVVCSAGHDTGFIPHKDVLLPLVMQPFREPAGGYYADTKHLVHTQQDLKYVNVGR